MEFSIIKNIDEIRKQAVQWNELATNAALGHPFLTVSWVDSWWSYFGQSKSDKLTINFLYLIIGKEGGKWIGAVPFYLTEYRVMSIPILRFLRPIGSDKNLTEIKPIFCLPGRDIEFFSAVRLFLMDQKKWDICQWPDIPLNFKPEYRIYEYSIVENFFLKLAPDWEQFRSGLKRNIKESIRKCINAPEKDGVNLVFIQYQAKEDILRELPEFFRLHGMRASKEFKTRHPDYFLDPNHQAFFCNLIENCREFEPRIFILRHDQKTIAARIGFKIGSTLYMYFSGYDPNYGAYSVATRLLVEAIKKAIEEGIQQVNLSTGRDESKLRWNPDIKSYTRFVSINKSIFSKMSYYFFAKFRAYLHKRSSASLNH